jgi:DNA-binding MarR family transcriptional regulator
MKYQALRQLIDLFEEFEQESGKDDVASFSAWLFMHQQTHPPKHPRSEKRGSSWSMESEIAYGVGTLNTHARHYIKTALKNSPLVGLHDFTFLATLVEEKSLRKTEIIDRNMMDLSPGMEVVRRLLRNGLIEDFQDPEDGRSKRIRLTEEGQEVFAAVLKDMRQVSQIVSGNLSLEEKATLIPLLQKLLNFHLPIWEKDHGAPLEKILKKYVP